MGFIWTHFWGGKVEGSIHSRSLPTSLFCNQRLGSRNIAGRGKAINLQLLPLREDSLDPVGAHLLKVLQLPKNNVSSCGDIHTYEPVGGFLFYIYV